MKTGLGLLLISFVLLYLGVDQLAHPPRPSNPDLGYPLSFFLGSLTPAIVFFILAIRQLTRRRQDEPETRGDFTASG